MTGRGQIKISSEDVISIEIATEACDFNKVEIVCTVHNFLAGI